MSRAQEVQATAWVLFLLALRKMEPNKIVNSFLRSTVCHDNPSVYLKMPGTTPSLWEIAHFLSINARALALRVPGLACRKYTYVISFLDRGTLGAWPFDPAGFAWGLPILCERTSMCVARHKEKYESYFRSEFRLPKDLNGKVEG